MGAKVQGHPARNRPHEGSGKRPSSSLHGRPSAANRISIHYQGAALPPSGKVQNASYQDVRWDKRPHGPPQYVQKSDGTARISESPEAQFAKRNNSKRPSGHGAIYLRSLVYQFAERNDSKRSSSHGAM